MRKHGRPNSIVTDKLRSCGTALKELGVADIQETGRWLNNRAENLHLLFDEESGRCFASGACEVCRNSPPFTPQYTISSIRSATYNLDQVSNATASLLSLSGGVSAQNRDSDTVQAETSSNWSGSTQSGETVFAFPKRQDHFRPLNCAICGETKLALK